MTKKVTVLFSGGIDSTSCIRFFSDRSYNVSAVYIDFGQASAGAETVAIEALKPDLGISVSVVRISSESFFGTGELVGRNAFLIFAAILLGGCRDGLLAIGVHAGTPYYDCSETFIERANLLVQECTDERVSLVAPFSKWMKDDIYSYFATLNLPLSKTYSCEAGTTPPCGRCASCKDRVRFECSRSVAI